MTAVTVARRHTVDSPSSSTSISSPLRGHSQPAALAPLLNLPKKGASRAEGPASRKGPRRSRRDTLDLGAAGGGGVAEAAMKSSDAPPAAPIASSASTSMASASTHAALPEEPASDASSSTTVAATDTTTPFPFPPPSTSGARPSACAGARARPATASAASASLPSSPSTESPVAACRAAASVGERSSHVVSILQRPGSKCA
mmetsp:Transcript_26301/g.76395  ORF Transcript_26301/g.76395 Transcript_26301/m.76395 type:complete len:202 (-) Transcript_26301:261-866(-)